MSSYRAGAIILLLTSVIVGCSSGDDDSAASPIRPAPLPAERTIHGTFSLLDGFSGRWFNCHGDGGYDDFQEGMNVTVKNENGTIIATSRARNLQESDIDSSEAWLAITAALSKASPAAMDACVLVFETDEIPDATFYSVEIGRRGEVTYSRAEMEANEWIVELSLGG